MPVPVQPCVFLEAKKQRLRPHDKICAMRTLLPVFRKGSQRRNSIPSFGLSVRSLRPPRASSNSEPNEWRRKFQLCFGKCSTWTLAILPFCHFDKKHQWLASSLLLLHHFSYCLTCLQSYTINRCSSQLLPPSSSSHSFLLSTL